MSNIFNNEKLINLGNKHPKFYIGVDTYDEKKCAYCMVVKTDDEQRIILAKTIPDKKQFEEEVNNLAKYFNAQIIKEL